MSRPVNHQRLGAPIAESDTTGYGGLGQRVRHPEFGEGTIVSTSKAAASTADCQVAFRAGIKRLVAAYARLDGVTFKKNIIIL